MASINAQGISDYRSSAGLDALIVDVNKLVSLPDIYYRLEAALESPTSTISDFATLLSADPDLCARLLRMANSAFYSFPSRIETVDRAISTIGMRQIRELVLVTSVIEMFEGVSVPLVNMRSFWEHSVAVGVFSRAIAQFCGLGQSERYYIPGLLHDIGRLVLYLKIPEAMSEMIQQSIIEKRSLFLLEREKLEYSHDVIGGRLLEFWRVPQSIFEPVNYHHDPHKSLEYSQATCAIHIADAWVNERKIGSSGEANTPLIEKHAMESISIGEDELNEIWSLAEEQISSVINQFLAH